MDATTAAPAADTELTLDALKLALAEPGEHRLFRSGKLAGLFPSRTGASADSALAALSAGLLETVRTEVKGRTVVEWVRATPKAVGYVHDRDSPKAVLRELRAVIGATRAGVPAWLDATKAELAAVGARFDRQAAEMLKRLDALTERVDAALRRAEAAGPSVPDPVMRLVPWTADALGYLDRRAAAGAAGDCPLGELFAAVRQGCPGLAVPEFHDGLRRLQDVRALRLSMGDDGTDPEFALLAGAEMFTHAGR